MIPMIAVRGALLAALVLLAPCSTHASIMNFDANFDSLKMEILSEGPMFTTLESPYRQTGKKSEIVVSLNWFPIQAGDVHSVAVVFTSNASVTNHGGLPDAVLKCEADHSTSAYDAHFFHTAGNIHAEYEITHSSVGQDFPRVLLFVCPCVPTTAENEMSASDPKRCWSGTNKKGVQFHGQVAFSNGFGYLAAKQFGYLPFYAVLTGAYCVLLTAYLVASMCYKEHLTALNYATLALCVVGMVECALYFVLYLWKNATGTPTWPPTPLQWAAAFVGVLKRDLARVLLIVVGLGYGVVKPSLPKCTVLMIVILALAFFVISVWKDIAKDGLFVDAEHAKGGSTIVPTILTLNESALLFVDVIMLAWTMSALVNTQQSLQASRQAEKLRMYNSLIGVMLSFVAVWGLFEAYRVCVVERVIALNWHLSWILNSFWHVSSFAILLTIAFVWRPSNTSEQLSYWTQIDGVDEEDDSSEMSMSELGDIMGDDEDGEEEEMDA